MSLKAGGVGLNLTAASNVFLMVCITSSLLKLLSHFLVSFEAEFSRIIWHAGSMVESCSRGASNHANSPDWPKADCPC